MDSKPGLPNNGPEGRQILIDLKQDVPDDVGCASVGHEFFYRRDAEGVAEPVIDCHPDGRWRASLDEADRWGDLDLAACTGDQGSNVGELGVNPAAPRIVEVVKAARKRHRRVPRVASGAPVDNILVIGHIHSTMDAANDIKMTHLRITPSLGRRIIDSALWNGDSVPDVILTAAQIALESRRTTDTAWVAAEFERQGRRIDRYGWIALED